MTTMIETVARAICKSRTCTGIACCEWPANGTGQTLLRYKNAPRCLVADGRFDDAARAAIEAMREPTDEMSEAALRLDRIEHGVLVTPIPQECWETMIDAALKEPP